jgi:hypothetical protein
MSTIDFGVYGPDSSLYKKSKAVVNSINPVDAYNNMVKQQMGALNGNESQAMSEILNKYPTMSRDVLMALVKAGANANTPGIGNLTSVDGVTQAVAAAQKLDKIPSTFTKDKSILAQVRDAIWTGAKATSRVTFAALRSPYDYGTTAFRDIYAIGHGEVKGTDALNLLGKDLNPANIVGAGQTGQFGSLMRDLVNGGGVSTGAGFFIDPNSRVGKMQAKAMAEYGKIQGDSYTIGRNYAFSIMGSNPNTEEYKVTSGIIDAVLNVAADPSTWASFGGTTFAKIGLKGAAQAGVKAAEVRRIAQAEHIDAILSDLKAMPTLRSGRAEVKKLKAGVIREYDNHFMRADQDYLAAQNDLTDAKYFHDKISESNLGNALKNQSKLLDDTALNKTITDIAVSGNQESAITAMGRLAADFENTQRAFPGALMLENLPTADKVAFGAHDANEFAVTLAKGKALKTVDLMQKSDGLTGKALETEIGLRKQLFDRLVEMSKDKTIPARTRQALRTVTNPDYIDNILFGDGSETLGGLISKIADTKNSNAMSLLTHEIGNIWKADAILNIRAIHGGIGGVAILNGSKIAAKGVKLTEALSSTMEGIYNPIISVEKAQETVDRLAKAREESQSAAAKIRQQIADVEAMRGFVAKDPQLARQIMNNPEYVDIKNIAELEAKIGIKEAYKEGLRYEAGLVDSFGGSLALDTDKVNKFILGRRFSHVAQIVANEKSVSRIMRLFNNKIDVELAKELALAETSDDVLRILRRNVGDPNQDLNLARSMTLRGESLRTKIPVTKTVLPVYDKALHAVEWMEKGLQRIYVRSAIAPLADVNRLVDTTRSWMSSVRVPSEEIDKAIDKLVMAEAGTDRNVLTVRSKILHDIVTDAQLALAKRIAPGDEGLLKVIQKEMKLVGKERDWLSSYSNSFVAGGDLPFVTYARGKKISTQNALYVSQFLDTFARFPDATAIEKAIVGYTKTKGILGKVEAAKVVANTLGEYWRAGMLAGRVSFILRNVGEMQIRQFLSGHETLLTNPIGYMAMMFGAPEGNKVRQLFSEIEKYKNDALGNSFKSSKVDKLLTEAQDEYAKWSTRHILHSSAGDPRSADARIRTFGKIYRTVTSENTEYYDALAPNLARFGVDDMMILVARAESDDSKYKLVSSLISNKALKIKGETRTNILKDIYDAAKKTDGESSFFDKIMLKDPSAGFSYDNINRVGVYNWLFDAKSTGSYASELNGLMGNGSRGAYLRKLIADGNVEVPLENGKVVSLKLPRYADNDLIEQYGTAEKAFRKSLEKAFPREEMQGARAVYAEQKGAVIGKGAPVGELLDKFFAFSGKVEDVANFGPEYRMAYWDHIGRYAPALSLKDLERLRKVAYDTLSPIKVMGKNISMTKNQTLRIIDREILSRTKNGDKVAAMTLEQANSVATKTASKYVQDLFYDASRQRMTANQLRLLVPFVQAHVNTIYKWAELSAKNPTQIYKFGKAFNALTQPGSSAIYDITNTKYEDNQGFFYKDEYGTMRFRYPLLGNLMGVLASRSLKGWNAAELSAPVQSLNLAFGTVNPGVPGFGPAVSIPYLLSGKSAAFGPTYDTMRNFLFPYGGPENAADLILPSWLNKMFLARVTDSAAVEQGVKNWAGYLASTGDYGDNPFSSTESRNKLMNDARTISGWNVFLGGLFQSIAPATPSTDVIARIPDNAGKSKFMAMTTLYKNWIDIQKANPGNYDGAVADFTNQYGLKNVLAIISGSSRAVTGTQDAWTFLNRNPEMVNKYSGTKTDVVPYFFPGGEAATAYYAWQKKLSIRDKLSPEQLADAATELVYNMELSQISDTMATMGYSQQWYSQQVVQLNNRYGGSKPVSTVVSGMQQKRVEQIGKALDEKAFQMSPVYNEAKTFYDAYENARQHLQNVRLTPEPDFGSSYWLNTKYRNELTQLGQQLITQNPQFANMYYLVFAGLLKENK